MTTRRGRCVARPPVLAALLLALLLAACKVDLFTGLNEQDANDMLAILMRHSISAEKTPGLEGTFTIQVEQDKFADAVELLKMQGFPREQFASIGEVFKKEGLISSPLEERVRLVYALSQELSATLSRIDGVLDARVHVVLPDNALSAGKIVPSSAAVFIRHSSVVPVAQLVPQIKMLVTNSIEGLAYDKVSVVLFPVEVPSEYVDDPAKVIAASGGGLFWLVAGGLGLLGGLGLGALAVLGYLRLKARRAAGAAADAPPSLPAPAE